MVNQDDELIATLENDDEELIATLESDVVYMGSGGGSGVGGTYTDNIGSTENIGGWNQNETAENMTFQDFAYKLLHKYYSPTVSFSINPNTTVYEVGTIVNSITFNINVTKKTNEIAYINIIVNNAIVETITDGVSSGGAFTYEYTGEITENATFNVSVNDGNSTVSGTAKSISFVYRSYYGFLDDISNLTEEVIKGLQQSKLGTTKGLTYDGITCDDKHIVYAYSSNLGLLTSIKDNNGFGYLDSYNKQIGVINGINYNIYYLTNKTSVAGFKQIYA